MKNKDEMRKKVLEMLKNDMRSAMKSRKFKDMMPEGKMKATIVGDTPEDIVKGAKMLPKVMNKAKSVMGEIKHAEDCECKQCSECESED